MKKRNRKNFTLIEVAVVMLVLVALAGITIPLALSYGQRAHGSTGAGNMAQLTSNINRFQAETLSYPDNWDNLLDIAGTDVYDATATDLSVYALVAGDTAKLNDAGISKVHPLIDATAQGGAPYSTFGGTGSAATLADGDDVVAIAGSKVEEVLGSSNDPADTYLAFGIGENLSAIGKTIASAPYDFPEGSGTPQKSYKRFIAVFNISTESVKFVGVVANDDGIITNIQDHIGEYYEAGE